MCEWNEQEQTPTQNYDNVQTFRQPYPLQLDSLNEYYAKYACTSTYS